jgi:hypothetical protein
MIGPKYGPIYLYILFEPPQRTLHDIYHLLKKKDHFIAVVFDTTTGGLRSVARVL